MLPLPSIQAVIASYTFRGTLALVLPGSSTPQLYEHYNQMSRCVSTSLRACVHSLKHSAPTSLPCQWFSHADPTAEQQVPYYCFLIHDFFHYKITIFVTVFAQKIYFIHIDPWSDCFNTYVGVLYSYLQSVWKASVESFNGIDSIMKSSFLQPSMEMLWCLSLKIAVFWVSFGFSSVTIFHNSLY